MVSCLRTWLTNGGVPEPLVTYVMDKSGWDKISDFVGTFPRKDYEIKIAEFVQKRFPEKQGFYG